MSKLVVGSSQSTLGPEPTAPTLREFALSDSDLKRLPRLFFNEFEHAASKRFFCKYASACIIFYMIIFRDDIHFSFGYVMGFFAFAFVFIIPFGIFWLIMDTAERKVYIVFNEPFARYCKYQNAMSAYRHRKADYDARLAKQQATYWRSLGGVAFEKELGGLFTRMGYEVQYTPSTSDGGVDLFLRRDGKLTVVQCKAHNKRISISVARELVASMIDFGADDGIIACFDGVTRPVAEYIEGKKISVLTVDEIVVRQTQFP